MSFPRFLLLALALCGTVWSATLVGNVVSHVLVPPTVYVLPIEEVEVAVPVVDHTVCVELLAAEVNKPTTECNSCHNGFPPSSNGPKPLDLDHMIQIEPDNGADSDTGGYVIEPSVWTEGRTNWL